MLEASWKQEPRTHIQPWILTSSIGCMCTRNGEVAEPLSRSLFGKQAYNQKDAIRKKRRQGTINSNPHRSTVMQFVDAYVINPPRSRLKWIIGYKTFTNNTKQTCTEQCPVRVKFLSQISYTADFYLTGHKMSVLWKCMNLSKTKGIVDYVITPSKSFEMNYNMITTRWDKLLSVLLKFLARRSYEQLLLEQP